MKPHSTDVTPHEAADKTARVVEALGTPDFAPKTLLQIAVAANVARSTTYRILKALEARRWVSFDAQSDAWSLDGDFTRFGVALMRYLDSRQENLDQEHARLTGAKRR